MQSVNIIQTIVFTVAATLFVPLMSFAALWFLI